MLGLVRLSVQEALTLCGGEKRGGALCVRHVAGVGAEIELGEVAVQVSLADVVEGAVNATLEEREMAFDRVGMHEAAEPHIFLGGMVDAGMAGELIADLRVDRAAVGHHVRFARGVLDDDGAKVLARHVGDMKAPGLTVSLDQGNDRHLAAGAAADALALPSVFIGLFAADVGFVDLNHLVLAP